MKSEVGTSDGQLKAAWEFWKNPAFRLMVYDGLYIFHCHHIAIIKLSFSLFFKIILIGIVIMIINHNHHDYQSLSLSLSLSISSIMIIVIVMVIIIVIVVTSITPVIMYHYYYVAFISSYSRFAVLVENLV